MKSIAIRFAAAAVFAGAVSFAGASNAQVMYGGYNLGPDYGAGLRQSQQQQQQMNQQMQQGEEQVIANAMRDPVCIQHYQNHRAQGGQMNPRQFAYECARQGRFTPGGQAIAGQVERQNQANEYATAQGLRQAEMQRGQAQQNYMGGYQRNNAEFGNYLQGRSTWTDPASGQQQALQHTQPGQVSRDPRTGQAYQMDNLGQYWAQAPNGQWYKMNPMR